ncbi:Plant transposon protein [Fragilaria crotonensis]|nr:Plant transposon protein [Fragilaria crotonensis]
MSSPFDRFSTSNWFSITDWSSSSTSATAGAGTQDAEFSKKRARANDYDDEVLVIIALAGNCNDEQDDDAEPTIELQYNDCNTPIKRRRISRNGYARWPNPDGSYIRLVPRNSYWYKAYIEYPDREDKTFHKKFRLRFRVPYAEFEELAASLEHVDCFSRWHDGPINASRVRSAPISLLVLTSLRYMRRGLTFDDVEEGSWINAEVIRVFFHIFTHTGAVLYDKTYNVTVNHRRRILTSTKGHPARWNDKTLATFDDFMQKINDGTILDDVCFELYDFDDDDPGEVIKRTYRGAWLLVDNGYHSWATTVPPIKTTNKKSEIRFSSWLESMRKDVECTFGILKGRWRILKSGIRVSGTECPDNIFLTCCALHNKLLEVDGLDKEWRNGVSSDWEGIIGEMSVADGTAAGTTAAATSTARNDNGTPTMAATRNSTDGGSGDNASSTESSNTLPNAIHRLLNPAVSRHDGNSTSACTTTAGDETAQEQTMEQLDGGPAAVRTVGGVHIVRHLSLPFFRSKLVRHFDIAFKRNEVQWPRHLKRKNPPAANL